MSTRIPAALVLCLLTATAASAQVSEKYTQWREGPVQWIMTGDEQKAWRNVKTDAEASAFVDLFWARRDPTPGTFENEFRAEHEGRVLVADRDWTEEKKRGSMTDRGRVYIVLGNPSKMAKHAARTTGSDRDASTIGGTGRVMSGREDWLYERELTKKWGVPEAMVSFILHAQSGRVTRDVQRTDFITASSGAIKSYIVDRDMKTVPEWAATGGLNPITFRLVPAAAGSSAPAATPATAGAAPAQSAAPAVVSSATIPAPQSFAPKGISRLTLSNDVFEVDTETKTDPFLTLTPVDAFKPSEELGWASQICTGSNDEPTVKYQLRLTGKAAGEEIDRAAEPDELVPDRIRALNGCYMMRGAVPLEGMSPGNYELEVSIYDPEARRDTVLRKAFRIE
ncbi:MAG TPA: GWxTD domain-containing protein [Thermoanaerobaculia bacterium]|nr:GWxTD domain-containing protein [Thermoanaerobaculia bacterium]